MPSLVRNTSHGVTLLGDASRPCGVTLAFTERGGGVSGEQFSSLNLGDACGDNLVAVAENRRRAHVAMGIERYAPNLVNPVQVHGDRVVVVAPGHNTARQAAKLVREGADAVVCAEAGVPVLLCSADCVLVILVAPMRRTPDARLPHGAFAVIHSGWRGTIARICDKAMASLVEVAGCAPSEVCAYVGPHIGVDDYEVSAELAVRFAHEFGTSSGVVASDGRHVDLGVAVVQTLVDAGVESANVCMVGESTARHVERFYSFRASGGTCGRMGALACMRCEDQEP